MRCSKRKIDVSRSIRLGSDDVSSKTSFVKLARECRIAHSCGVLDKLSDRQYEFFGVHNMTMIRHGARLVPPIAVPFAHEGTASRNHYGRGLAASVRRRRHIVIATDYT